MPNSNYGSMSSTWWFVRLVVVVFLCFPFQAASSADVAAFIVHNTTADESGVWLMTGDTYKTIEIFAGNATFSSASPSLIHLTTSDTYCTDNNAFEDVAVTVASEINANTTLFVPDVLEETVFYFCIDNVHQGDGRYKTLYVTVKPSTDPTGLDTIPLGLQIFFVIILLCLSGTFSGLNLGLMALDKNELDILQQAGSSPKANERQRMNGEYARKIYPLRKRGNLLLCTVLIGNVLVNSSMTILLDALFASFEGGTIVGLLVSTFGIVIFGEIIPQAICSRRGLVVGAKAVPLVWAFVVITFVVSFPLSIILDIVLGEEVGSVFNRAELLQMLKITEADNDLDHTEMAIVKGALTYREKLVKEVMTTMSDVYCLSIDTILDFKQIKEIFQRGHSRIPVYENEECNIVGILYMKELAFVDPDDRTALKTIVNFYKHKLHTVEDDVQLDVLLAKFIRQRSHLILVQKLFEPEDGKDNYFELVGIVTLEDVIEEIIGNEINDEDDEVLDNKSKFKIGSSKNHMHRLFPKELEGSEDTSALMISDQMAMAAITFLAGNVEKYFGMDLLPRNTLGRLVRKKESCKVYGDEDTEEEVRIYAPGQLVDRLVLVLEGKVRMTIGKENFCFDQGPFSIIGKSALDNLEGSPDVADFTAIVPIGTKTTVIQISRKQYKEALAQGQLQNSTPQMTRRISRQISGPSDEKAFNRLADGNDLEAGVPSETINETSDTNDTNDNDDTNDNNDTNDTNDGEPPELPSDTLTIDGTHTSTVTM